MFVICSLSQDVSKSLSLCCRWQFYTDDW